MYLTTIYQNAAFDKTQKCPNKAKHLARKLINKSNKSNFFYVYIFIFYIKLKHNVNNFLCEFDR